MTNTDKHNRFAEQVFSYRATKDDRIFIYWNGKQVTTLRDKDATKFVARVKRLGDREAQLVMAKLTGNFKRGNER